MSAVDTFPAKVRFGSNSLGKDSRKTLWSDSEGEGSDNDETNTKEERPLKDKFAADESKSKIEKPKDRDTLFTSDFDSEWDRFPTSQEFKNIYGEAIWERLSSSYNDLAKSLDDIDKKPEEKREKEKRTTCWDAFDNKPTVAATEDSSSDKQPKQPGEKGKPGRPPGRPKSNPDLTPEQLAEKKWAEKQNNKNLDTSPEQPRIKRKYTRREDKEKILAALAAKGEITSENKGYKPRATRGDAKNNAPRSLQCLHCDKRFESKGQARPHLEVHSGIKPYKCSECDYKSYSKHNVTDAHFSKRHGRKGTKDDIITDQNDKENLKALVIMESEQMLERQDQIDKELASQKDLNDLNDLKEVKEPQPDDTGNDSALNSENKDDKTDAIINESEEWLEKMSKEMYATNDDNRDDKIEDNNDDDEDDTNISPDLLDSLCAETDSTESKEVDQISPIKEVSNSNVVESKEVNQISPIKEVTNNDVDVKRKRASSYDSASDFENNNTKKLDWAPASKKAALEQKITSLENSTKDSVVASSTSDLQNNNISDSTSLVDGGKKRKRFSSDIADSNNQNTTKYDWLPAAKKPPSECVNEPTKSVIIETDTEEAGSIPTENVAKDPDTKVAGPVTTENIAKDKDKDVNNNIDNNDDDKEKDENNNNEDENAELKPLPEKGKISDFIQKLPKIELTDPIEIQLAQVTGKGPKPMAKCRLCQREGRQDNIKNHVQRMHADRVVDSGSD